MKNIGRSAYIFILTLIFTPLWIMLSYLKWQYLDVDLGLALSSFNEWPWIKGTIVVTLFTYLYSYYAYFQYEKKSVSVEESASVYVLLYIWFFFFIFYPGSEAFGGSDSNSLFWMTGILVTHYFAVKFFTMELVKSD